MCESVSVWHKIFVNAKNAATKSFVSSFYSNRCISYKKVNRSEFAAEMLSVECAFQPKMMEILSTDFPVSFEMPPRNFES